MPGFKDKLVISQVVYNGKINVDVKLSVSALLLHLKFPHRPVLSLFLYIS